MAKYEITEVPGTGELSASLQVEIGYFVVTFQPNELLDLKKAIKAFFKTKKKEKKKKFPHSAKACMDEIKKQDEVERICINCLFLNTAVSSNPCASCSHTHTDFWKQKPERDSVCEKCKDTGFTRDTFSVIRVCTHCSAAKEIMQENGL